MERTQTMTTRTRETDLEDISAELDSHYATYPRDVARERRELDALNAAHPDWLPYRRKAAIYEVAARLCPVKVFRLYPFYFEVATGRPRNTWGFAGIGNWLLAQPSNRQLSDERALLFAPAEAAGLYLGNTVVDLDHHCVGYDNVLSSGLAGIAAQAERRLRSAATDRERSFLESCVIAQRSLTSIAVKFAEEAARLLATERDPAARRNLQRIAESAGRTPAAPPATFYEALNTILFMRELCGSLDGIGISTFGHLDRMLDPYLRADLLAGRIVPQEVDRLLEQFLILTDVKFEMARHPRETSTTVIIGGCDADGAPVFNDVTRAIIRAYRKLRLTNPKLNVRLSPGHPAEFSHLLGDLVGAGTNVTAVFNDDVVIAANVKSGKAIRDARLYVGGGCQENVLQNTEINSRCSLYVNLPQAFNLGFLPDDDRWAFLRGRYGLALESYAGSKDFAALYERCFRNLGQIFDFFIGRRSETEKEGWRYNPCPLLSSTIGDCIPNAKDMMEGGCRYSYGSVSPIGVGTLVDSLFAVRKVVFEERCVTLDRLGQVLRDNFAGEEVLRQHLANRVPKFGHDNEAIRTFSARVFADLADLTTGKPNGRGGRYEAGLMSYRFFTTMGEKTDATPDGRRAGEFFSQGMGPSLVSAAGDGSLGSLVESVRPLDLTAYASIGVLDGKLPWSRATCPPEAIAAVLNRFLDCGGSVLQLNVADQASLLDAQARPEQHQDLIVRVSGYSARFVTLPRATQDEIIEREVLRP
jgi:formate C-acetyltransferase